MATASLLEAISLVRDSKLPSLKWNPLLQGFPSQIPLRSTKNSKHLISTARFGRTSRFSARCFLDSKKCTTGSADNERNRNLFEGVVEAILKALKTLQKPAIAAVLLGFLLTYDPHSALAASGGRMGGRAFSSHSSSSYSSRSYSSRTASPSFSYSMPYYAPSPFGFSGGGGFYVGPAFGVGVGAGSSFLLIMAGFAAFILVSGFLSDRSEGSVLTDTQKTSVLKLQVGLLGMARSLQRDLDRIAQNADTSTSEGLSYVLTETTLALLRHPDCCISGYSSVDVKRSMEDGEKRFNQLSIEERGKFDEETLVNVNNIRRQSTTTQRANGFSNEYIVITILVAAEGVHKLPAINGSADLKEALQKLGSIPSRKTLAVEVLWTPQNENDTLSERELLEDYPLLRPL
ncbi:PREDICTED: uncharacterized protein LOC104611801 [Nelumbo nucifera]|uniref:Uncharacterized protein LOC104611801 n=2 Tax=Nelumbo nucifera TaxID=4432 RepID=A0A1U8BJP5_NELNU|nr:PREDICTED: uncharacterized protein LOC104611801 [Nelumbo nucifera]DAD33675.1 TPA_asm: hypothetical protein HUJ06_012526 [Nelumbo nucifera]